MSYFKKTSKNFNCNVTLFRIRTINGTRAWLYVHCAKETQNGQQLKHDPGLVTFDNDVGFEHGSCLPKDPQIHSVQKAMSAIISV